MEFIQTLQGQILEENPLLAKPSVAAVFLVLVAFVVLRWRAQKGPKLDYPVLGDVTQTDFRPALEEGAKKYPKSPFVIATPMHPTVILPVSAIKEIKALPENILSLRQHHYTIFLGKYTGFGEPCDELDAAIRVDLTRHLEQNLATFYDEVEYAYRKHVGDSTDWTPVPLYDAILGIVCLLSSRVFVGLPLSRDEEWSRVTMQYSLDAGHGAHSLSPYPNLLRPLVAPFILKRLSQHRAAARRMLQPVLDKITAGHRRNSAATGRSVDTGGDLMQYIMGHYKRKATIELLARDQLVATFVAMHTTTICITQTLFDLAARPEYLAPLREELALVLATDGAHDGRLHKESMLHPRKPAHEPPGLVSMLRHVTAREGLHLSTGHVIPYGSVVGISAHEVTRSYPNGDKFDGFRFSKLREQPGQATMHQLVATGPDHLAFGHGTHGCPGRFFAASEIKVIMAYLLQNYDIRLEDGATRPENLHVGCTVAPSSDAKVLFRRRKDGLI
ncbi:cytochrome P450 [Aspergillus novofumigatus IBT 16806]|uniref:Putative P450 monooxygenase n=1 Tax=Aspergillus novofumigatus (strain IBT 16806) TaxID=1392255 RepID=A0A2I1BSR0_ASPN1|nr:putative P450 monooxygenase [Aspergillus novofumigatus IBT 16806]PKX88428.1 putative P450 monooxygenase [Aspergillus novofumigatus IBT 16806]